MTCLRHPAAFLRNASTEKKLHPRFYDNVYSICVEEGFRPTIAQEVTTFAEAMAMVADGVGFAFTHECCTGSVKVFAV
jgi:hypothetical protein